MIPITAVKVAAAVSIRGGKTSMSAITGRRRCCMRLTMLMVLSSSLAFAQNAGQMQAKQDIATHNLQGAQQSAQFQQMLNSSVNSPFTPAPRLSPKPGSFQGRIPTVSITDDIKGAVIYFTTDGSMPTPRSQRYTGPISFSATTTLKAIAIAPSFTPSRTVIGKYIVK